MNTLTIAIPTYNRVESLTVIVNKIIPYLNSNINLLIIDNNSSDGTRKFLEENKKTNYFKYLLNVSNIGGAVNMLKCIENSCSEYTWLLGDDDNIDPKLLEDLVRKINKSKRLAYHLIPFSRKHIKITKFLFHDIKDFKLYFYDIAAINLMASGIYKTIFAQEYLREAYKIVHLQHSFSLFLSKALKCKGIVEILKVPILKKEQIREKRWSKFIGHVDAIETSYINFGSCILRREYNTRINQLKRIAIISLFTDKNESFNSLNIRRLQQMFGIYALFSISYLKLLNYTKRNAITRYITVLFVFLYYFYKYGSEYSDIVKLKFDISSDKIFKSLYTQMTIKNNEFMN